VAKTAMFAKGLAMSFGGIDRRTPLIGPFLAMYDRLGVDPDRKVMDALSDQRRYGIQVTDHQAAPDREAIIAIFTERYQITREEILAVERVFSQVTRLPMYFGDRLFSLLSSDYR
jgi:hypothetical protein